MSRARITGNWLWFGLCVTMHAAGETSPYFKLGTTMVTVLLPETRKITYPASTVFCDSLIFMFLDKRDKRNLMFLYPYVACISNQPCVHRILTRNFFNGCCCRLFGCCTVNKQTISADNRLTATRSLRQFLECEQHLSSVEFTHHRMIISECDWIMQRWMYRATKTLRFRTYRPSRLATCRYGNHSSSSILIYIY